MEAGTNHLLSIQMALRVRSDNGGRFCRKKKYQADRIVRERHSADYSAHHRATPVNQRNCAPEG